MTFFFFFQAEDGIRDDLVTGVQTCALPICTCATPGSPPAPRSRYSRAGESASARDDLTNTHGHANPRPEWRLPAVTEDCRPVPPCRRPLRRGRGLPPGRRRAKDRFPRPCHRPRPPSLGPPP